MKIPHVIVALLCTVTLGITMATLSPKATSQQLATPNKVIARHAALVTGRATRRPYERQLVSGVVLSAYLERTGAASRAAAQAIPGVALNTLGCQKTFTGAINNVRVNQDCSFRRQAEQFVAIHPRNPQIVMAGANDYREGFAHCSIGFSYDRGTRWGDLLVPYFRFYLGNGRVPDASGDPSAAFDADGNAYNACILFQYTDAPSAIGVMKSNRSFAASTFHTPAPVPFQAYQALPLGLVVNDNDPNIFNDKEFLNADANLSSPKKNYVYVTWTKYNLATGAGVGANSPIFFSQSTDGGATWSPGIEISGANAAACTAFSGESNPNACDQDQGSWPEIGPDGTLYVSFYNGNTPTFGVNQHMMVKCLAASDCTLPASWTAPVKIADDIALQPFSAPLAGCPAGTQCLPPNGYRMNDFGVVRVDPSTPGRLYFMWSDFRNGGPCASSGGLPVEPCANHNNDVFLAVSTDGGATWGAPINVTPSATFGLAAQWQGWMAVGPTGKLYLAYYDRSYGSCESTGCNDITLATSTTAGASFTYTRITTSSMPNLVPPNPEAGFIGDYMFVAADSLGSAIVWTDTRGRLKNIAEMDLYFAKSP